MVDGSVKGCVLGPVLIAAVVISGFAGPASALDGSTDPTTTNPALGTDVHRGDGELARQSIRIGVRSNGSALVRVRYRIPLTDANETAAFERLRRNVTANAAGYRTRFRGRMDGVVASARATTGRKMAMTDLSVDATRRENTGLVTYTFVWQRFATTAGKRVRVGDALSGLYLEDGTRLRLVWPAGYAPTTIRPSPDVRRRGTLRWDASTAFGEHEPFVELAPRSASNARTSPSPTGSHGPTAPATDDTPNGIPDTGFGPETDGKPNAGSGKEANATAADGSKAADGDGGSNRNPLPLVAGVIAGAGAVVLTAWYGRRAVGSRSEPDASSAANAPTGSGAGSADRDDGEAEDLLSNEERVIRVIERAGGRVKQQRVVEELGWTEAKTSQVVGKLREEGTIEGFRLGRENVLTVSDGRDDGTENGDTTE